MPTAPWARGKQRSRARLKRLDERLAPRDRASIEDADGDAASVARALGDIARAKGMSQVARDSGLSRESLYKALSGERNPELATILKVVRALGLTLSAGVATPGAGSPTTRSH
ncbi:MAG: putative addiction module antidote protein [Myxococcales bacterium]|nr:putative addiction module antidote protein [Myxococcales bacterium]MCB9521613.1 putative addiction module antidote protein [Myxococcales bacterium]MCB9532419.1 putative addiction module antidote protein [Myxococcales bacterium]